MQQEDTLNNYFNLLNLRARVNLKFRNTYFTMEAHSICINKYIVRLKEDNKYCIVYVETL
jgi:hypothetical protein